MAKRRPSPGNAVRPSPKPVEKSRNVFSDRWLTLRINRGELDLRAAPLAAKALRDCLMSGYGQGGATVPEWVSGHQADGAPSRDPHLAVVPLANAGWQHADGALLGFAVVPPHRRGDLLLDDDFRRALGRVAALDAGGRRVLRLAVGKGLDRPILLDRHLKAKDGQGVQAEIEGLVADACERVTGVRPMRVVADKHAAVRGAPSAYPSGGAPRWTGWRIPEALRSRRLTHAVIEFAEPVAGPVLIGAGRFCGLGLCLSLDPEPER